MIETILLSVLEVLEKRPEIAARFRAVLGVDATAGDDWIPLSRVPLAKKTARHLARTGQVAARLVRGRWYVNRASIAAHLRDESGVLAKDDPEESLRVELGLRRAS